MRGKAERSPVDHGDSGITPAYAGKRVRPAARTATGRDHPRLCGEKKHRTYIDSKVKGSPPPMRGKELDGGQRKTIGRITPAYAGKRDFVKRNLFVTQDHPRLCGEKVPPVLIVRKFQGSPPPMRGKARLPFCKFLPIRITPAYAGKSSRSSRRNCVRQDPPRLCGEKDFKPPNWFVL